MFDNPDLEEALALIQTHTCPLSTESISILESLGRVSAINIQANSDLPFFTQSAVDGYALAIENENAGRKYFLAGHLPAGKSPLAALQPGQALGILTGGNLPNGTIAVVPHEKVQLMDYHLYPLEEIKPGNNIKQAGEDYASGEQLIRSGSIISAADISLMAAFGISSIEVYRQPRVAVFCLSKNIIPLQLSPEPGQTRDSNGPLLASLIQEDGGIPIAIQSVDIDSASVQATAAVLLEQVDMLIITGGTYAEENNEASLLMKELGAELLYGNVAIQPGNHTGASLWNSRLLFALSGNPATCAVGYHLFVAPALRTMQGLSATLPRMKARCANGFTKKSESRRFIRGHLSWTETGWQVTVLPGQKPSMIRSLVGCNALIDMPAASPPIEAGTEVSALVLRPLLPS